MSISRGTKVVLTIFAVIGFAFIYIPLGVILINSFSTDKSLTWPPSGYTTEWWGKAVESEGVREALWTSIWVAERCDDGRPGPRARSWRSPSAATRSSGASRCRCSSSCPIALPGIVTGIALNNVFTSFLGGLTIYTLIISHATFCIVVVYNNSLARIRRMGGSVEEASADLGANGWRTFVFVTFPLMRSALIAGAILAFGLSFDEIIVTTFTAGPGITTLPIWIYQNLFRPNQAPIVNVVAAALVLVSIVPIYIAQKFSNADERGGGLM